MNELLRRLPAVDRLLSSPEVEELTARYSRERVVEALREALSDLRRRVLHPESEESAEPDLSPETLIRDAGRRLETLFRPYYRPVVNATGVVLHTNLGRAPLPRRAVQALAEAAGRPQRVEMSLETGERGGRDLGVSRLLTRLTGGAAATVVNNNAAATLLILAALARGKRVIVSRGELVEIGGSYRVPEILAESGGHLSEVGTTNRTHPRDYVRAIEQAAEDGAEVGLLLKVHTSNYRVVGFTREVTVAELAAIGREHGLPVVHDLGSGSLVDLGVRGLPGEPTVRESLDAGADLVCFSGDKLLGGPQAGVLVGREDLVARCRRHPLFRAVRPGRLVYTALAETLRLYLEGDETAVREIPSLARLLARPAEIEDRARRLAGLLADVPGLAVEVVETASQAGSGSMPARDTPSFGVRLTAEGTSPDELAGWLRSGDPAVVGRVMDGAVVLDLRTVGEDELGVVAERLRGGGARVRDRCCTQRGC
jgi:L-seryl-tRNA(Ser) seleniumtransferase